MGHALPLRAVKGYLSDGLLPHKVPPKLDCAPCVQGKSTLRFSGSWISAAKVGRLHCDTKEKIDTECADGHYYYLTVADEYTRYA